MDFSFDSVGKFLREVQGAKAQQREAISEHLEPFLEDPATFMVSPSMCETINDLVDAYGDEVLKQVGIVALGKWATMHREILEEHIANENTAEGLFTMRDLATITNCIRLLSEVGSFGGEDDYRQAMNKEINQAVLEKLEETGRSPEDFINGGDDELRKFL